MNRYRTETFCPLPFLLWLGVGEGAVRDRDIVADVGELHRRPMALRVHRGPAVHLQAARCRGVAQESERQLPILAGILRSRDDDTAVGALQDLGLAVKVGGTRVERYLRLQVVRPGGFLTTHLGRESQLRTVGDAQ